MGRRPEYTKRKVGTGGGLSGIVEETKENDALKYKKQLLDTAVKL